MSKFLDRRFRDLVPYTPGEQPRANRYIKLNTNESPYPPSPKVRQAVQKQVGLLNRYPDPTAEELTIAMAASFKVEPECVFLGNGSDEILAFVFQALCPNGAVFADITYGFYRVYCDLYGTEYEIKPLKSDLSIDVKDYFLTNKTIIVANPNAPTALFLRVECIAEILKRNPDTLVAVDEAYVDFGAESTMNLLKTHNNLLIIGTYSKSCSLAGARLGYAVASPEIISDLKRIKYSFNPYNLNRMTIAAGIAVLDDGEYYEKCIRRICETRHKTTKALQEIGFVCTNSKTNFIFAMHPRISGKILHNMLWERGILVRWFDNTRISEYIRITIGTDEEMDILLSEISKLVC